MHRYLLWIAGLFFMAAGSAQPLAPLPETPPPLRWFDHAGPTDNAFVALDALMQADSHGLEPADYQAAALKSAVLAGSAADTADPAQWAPLDAALTQALLRYLRDLHQGRLNPRTLQHEFKAPATPPFDPQAYLDAALAGQYLLQALDQAAPRLPLYQAIRDAMQHYRGLDAQAWEIPLAIPRDRKSVKPGEPYDQLAALVQRLVTLGDLPLGSTVPASYDDALTHGVQSFQERHGLQADGVLGAQTLAALNTPPAERVTQMALTLERLRWTPLLHAPRMIVVNIPEFTLRAYEVQGHEVDIKLEMRVIVGKALNTRTPVFQEDMRFIEFSPYWNVPPSIARGETLPRLRRDPAYFAGQGFEFVTREGQVVTELTPQAIDAVARGEWRIRQRPGPANALGDIKFIFPNDQNIYLHHTPSPGLFERVRRDFSHGCIRIEYPVELAKFVLDNNPLWPESRIRQAMGAGKSQTIRLDQAIPVLIAYSTAVVKSGKVYFFPDIYQQDSRLHAVLKSRAAAPLPLP
jgi:murein L,D-transpeptidase YcbB/YkuD